MPKKKSNVKEVPMPTYDIELSHGAVKARSIVPYADFIASINSVVDAAFADGYSPARLSYLYYATLFALFTDYPATNVEIDDVMHEVYVNHLDQEIYDASAMAIAFRDAVRDTVEYHKNRSSLDVFLEKVNALDTKKLEGLLATLSSVNMTKEDITKTIVNAIKE